MIVRSLKRAQASHQVRDGADQAVLVNFLVRHAMLFGFFREGCQQARGVLFALLHLGAGESRNIHECVAKECAGNFDFDFGGNGGEPAVHQFRELRRPT